MADFAFNDAYDVADESHSGGSVTTLMNWAGAIISLALIAGLASWGWQLLKRDVSGVPVITAMEGPMRIAPENPGGAQAEHQGLAVNRIQATGEAAPGADQVVLAPQPVALTDEDAAMATLLPETETVNAANAAPVADIQGLSATDLAVVSALASLDEDLTVDAPAEIASFPNTSRQAVATSVRPQPRPQRVMATTTTLDADTAIVQVSSSGAGLDLDAASIPAGTRLVQLGAYPSVNEAQSEWGRIDTTFEDYMGGKRRVIQEAETGGKTFYRLRVAGFDDLSDARRFCAVLVAGEASCIPVVAR